MVFATDLVTNVFHEFAEYLYGKNMQVSEKFVLNGYLLKETRNSGAARLGAWQVLSGESQLWRPSGFLIISGLKHFLVTFILKDIFRTHSSMILPLE